MSDDYSAQLKKAFQDLQAKVATTNRLLQQDEASKKVLEQKQRCAELTSEQIRDLEKGRPVYRSIGRIFIRTNVDSEIKRHADEGDQAKEKIAAINRHKEYLERSLAESESNLRELVQSRP